MNLFSKFFKKDDIQKAESTKKQYADVLVINEKGQFLILLRSRQDDFEPGKWCLPGGKIDEGEKPDFAAKRGEGEIEGTKRELLEETGIDALTLTPCCTKETKDATIHMFRCYQYEDELFYLDRNEHIGYAWIESHCIDDYDFLLDLKETLNEIFQGVITPQVRVSTAKKAFEKGEITEDEFLGEIEKAIEAGHITGTDTTGQTLTQQPLKKESVEGSKKKDYVKLSKDEVIEEHKRLVDVLESDSHEDDKEEAKKQKQELEEYVKKGFDEGRLSEDEYLDTIEKSHKGTIGEIREWNGKKFKKQANGKWLQVSEHGMTKEEHTDEAKNKRQIAWRTTDDEYRKKFHDESKSHEIKASSLSDKEHTDEEVGIGEDQ